MSASVTLTLIRGLPGSGKSTLAASMSAVHLEADMYFISEQGLYTFNPSLLAEAHQWCQQQCICNLQRGNDVVVANTFVKQWELDIYRKIAQQNNARIVIKTCHGEYRNIHGVNEQTIMKMKQNWQA